MKVASYIQTRGSIPLIWTQTPTLKYNPSLGISGDDLLNERVATQHLEDQVKKYKDNVLVNLIDKKGSQKTVGDAFTKVVKKVNNEKIHYTWFDFHHECRKMQWHNIGKLIDEIKPKMESFDYFMATIEGSLSNPGEGSVILCSQ